MICTAQNKEFMRIDSNSNTHTHNKEFHENFSAQLNDNTYQELVVKSMDSHSLIHPSLYPHSFVVRVVH